jgi:hypothetical protein
MTPPSATVVMSLLVARARKVEREAAARGRPLAVGLAQGLALMHLPDDPDLERLMTERMLSTDPEQNMLDLHLRSDLARLGDGWRPGPHALVEATALIPTGLVLTPFAKPWTISLTGLTVDQHGRPTGRRRITSFLVAADARDGLWVRTWNRFYRLIHGKGGPPDLDHLPPEDGR